MNENKSSSKIDLFHSYLSCEWWNEEEKKWISVEFVFDPHNIILQKINLFSNTKIPIRNPNHWGTIYLRLKGTYDPLPDSEEIVTSTTRVSTTFPIPVFVSNTNLQEEQEDEIIYTREEIEKRGLELTFFENKSMILVLEDEIIRNNFYLDMEQYFSVCETQLKNKERKKAEKFQPYRLTIFNNRCRVTLYRKGGWKDIALASKNMYQLVGVREAFLYFQPHRLEKGGLLYCCDIREDLPPFQYAIPETILNVNDIHELCFGHHFLEFQTMAALDKSPTQCFTLIQGTDKKQVHMSLFDETSCKSLLKHLTDYYSVDLHKKIESETPKNIPLVSK